MYQLISAVAKQLAGAEQWSNIDITTTPLNELFNTYSKLIVTLSNPFLPTNVAIDLNSIRSSLAGHTITFPEFLILNGNKTLVALPNIPSLEPKYAKYADAFHAGYKVEAIGPRTSITSLLPAIDKTWLHMTKAGVDYNLFYKNCLVNVNGFFHLTDYDTNGMYVIDGMRTQHKSRQNQIGIYSFRDVGNLTFLPITKNMLFKREQSVAYKDEVHLDAGMDLSNKTVLLILGGYLHVLDNKTVIRVSSSEFKLVTANLPLIDRYYESEPYLDLSSLNLSKSGHNVNQIAVSDLYSDASIESYLTLSQSFFVILDNTSIFINNVHVKKTPFPNMFISFNKPEFPLVVGLGKVTNFWYTLEDGQYSLTCHDTMRSNRVYDTIDQRNAISVDDSCITTNPFVQSNAYMLQIGTVFN